MRTDTVVQIGLRRYGIEKSKRNGIPPKFPLDMPPPFLRRNQANHKIIHYLPLMLIDDLIQLVPQTVNHLPDFIGRIFLKRRARNKLGIIFWVTFQTPDLPQKCIRIIRVIKQNSFLI